jgi:hypothetical protein
MLAISHSSVLPSAHWNSVGALISDPFHGSITLPACPPVNASRAALRLPAHDSGPGWLATPYLYDFCIRDFTPVYPGALQFGSKYKPLHAFNCATLLLRNRMQINFARDLRCRVPQQCLHRSYWSAYDIKHRRVAVP